MKSRIVLLSLCGATLLALATSAVLSRHSPARPAAAVAEQTYEVSGKVVSIDASAKTIRIAHEAIPDYMPAMTMPFTVKGPIRFQELAPGDRIQFQLVVTDTDSWISRIRKTAAAAPQVAEPAAQTVREAAQLQVGEKLPDFELLNQDGKRIHLHDFAGKVVVLTFVYTRCPLPNFCPLMSRNFASLQERLVKEFAGRFQLLSVSIDPEFDQPEILKSYGLRYGADTQYWTFATGTTAQIDAVADLMGLTHEPENGFIAHDLRTALISPEGKLVHLWKSNVWTPYEIERQVRETLTGSMDRLARR